MGQSYAVHKIEGENQDNDCLEWNNSCTIWLVASAVKISPQLDCDDPFPDLELYQNLVDSLKYLTLIRSEKISFCIQGYLHQVASLEQVASPYMSLGSRCWRKTLKGKQDCKQQCGNLEMDQRSIGMTDCSSNGVVCQAFLKATKAQKCSNHHETKSDYESIRTARILENQFDYRDIVSDTHYQFEIIKCRQKTLCVEEDCKRCGDLDMDQPCLGKTDCSVCHSSNGVLCRACLKVRYGEEMEVVRRNKQWMCPHCIEDKGIKPYWICNSSLCLRKRKKVPTGVAIFKAREMGYKSVAHLLMDELQRTL
ncbi:hypothetical protein TEA_029648 [Camellia sinensis var. sinensis]|uniref:Zinc-finger domain-containing protein n=1 Tax=Camellia sinensis var. sinensis TaxID=542762 RepID=A0A4V3WP92_CAMSN|nr:hypothetical protein TEA_029648 [Camellia sinensis var. sinensis]